MANINFYLKSTKTDKLGMLPVIIQISHDYKKFRKQLSKVKPAHWNKKKQRVKPNRESEDYNGYIEINKLLDDYEAKTKAFFNECLIYNFDISEKSIQELLQGKDARRKKEVEFFDAFNEFIESQKSTRAERTIKGYTTVQNFLLEFEKETGSKIKFRSINLTFFDLLQHYAFELNEFSDNYFAKIVSVLKRFLNWCNDREYYNNSIHKKFSAPEREKDVICLTIEELVKLHKFKFNSEKLNKTRDIYCFGCFTGLRISDILQLKPEHIYEGVIKKAIQKTGQTEIIPLIQPALDIIKRYEGSISVFPKISSQKLNDYIKDCCKGAEINTLTTVSKFSGGKRIEETKEKYEFITFHTARKTFVSNSLRLGIDAKTIKSLTGHKKDASFNKYLKIEEDFKKQQMDNTWGKLDLN